MNRSARILAVLALLAYAVLPGSLTLCLAAEDEACACCSTPVTVEESCCSGEPAPAAQDDGSCCILLDLSPAPWLSTTPSLSLPTLSGAASILPAHEAVAVPALRPFALDTGPPPPVPAHIRFCSPRA